MTNADYKIMTRIWAKRLDKVLKKHIGHHQRGFISERDGRENILMVQMLMEDRDTRGLPGASVFLDIAKAFDSVSHESLIHLLKHIGFPRRFISTVMAIYGTEAGAKKNEVNFIINGELTDTKVVVESGTRQGCPLSPLLYILMAELFNQAIIKNEQFTGHKVGNFTKKISAYADDTAAHISNQTDLEILLVTIKDFELATGLKVNMSKTKIVPLGSWRNKSNSGTKTKSLLKFHSSAWRRPSTSAHRSGQ